MKKLTRSILGALLFIAAACSYSGQRANDEAAIIAATEEGSASRYIFTVSQLQALLADLKRFPTSNTSCNDASLQTAIDEHSRLYEFLMEEKGYLVDVSLSLTEKSLARVVPDGAAIVFSYAAGNKLCVWLIDNKGKQAFGEAQGGHEAIVRLLATFYRVGGIEAEQLSRSPVRRDTIPQKKTTRRVEIATNEVLNALSSAVFPGEVRASLSAYEQIVIVPYGALGTVPYAALPNAYGDALIEKSEVIVAPSLYDFYGARRASIGQGGWRIKSLGCETLTPTPLGSPLIIGDPNYSFDPDFEMPPLPGAKAEAIAVAKLFGVSPLIGNEATLQAVVARTRSAPIIYFATHGVSHETIGEESFIALTKGRWAAKNVQNSCLNQTKLAVLSACQTGLGQNVEGGTISLARAFQKAGVEAVAMSLWNVEDEATRDLMTGFAGRVRDGDRPSTAMRAAMLDTRKRFPAPRQWASFLIFSAHVAPSAD